MYIATGCAVVLALNGQLICRTESEELAIQIAATLNYAAKVAAEANDRARFYERNPY